jgi:capsular exopolysaccharide synthesis family protein
MSRIDEALKRAGETGGPPANPGPTPPPSGDPMPAADSEVPWNLEGVEVAPLPPDRAAREGTGGARALTQPPVPAFSPQAPPTPPFTGFKGPLSEKIVTGEHARPQAVEQYRRLAATLHHAQADRGIKVILVASAAMAEGKTLTSTNLALTLSESYRRRVLLVDADLRRPSLHDVFQLPNLSGLSDGLEGEADARLSLLQVSAMLTVLPAGRPLPDPMGALTSGRMRRILDEAREAFDWVIIDTPPVGMLTDANLLASMVDGAVLVVSAGMTPFGIIQKAVEALGRERVLGVVLNRVDPGDQAHPDGYGYGYYYGYGGRRQ